MYALTDYMSHYRGSPHFSHLDHPSSTPTTPSPPYPQYAQPLLSSMSQQAIPQSRQPTSYPSPHSYPSPSMSSYAYPPPQQQPQQQAQQQPQQNIETYRSSPTASHVSLPSLSLPPLRAIDPRNPTSVQAPMGSPIPAGGTPVANYYVAAAAAGQAQSLPPPGAHMNITSTPHAQGLRYPLPAPEGGRIMSGGRHKKEIKRRTKTGCLTCRKRRIKCDEAHPTCRNCQKSKRECLGYDPIFKAQSGPAAIQPAPSSAPPLTPTLTTPTSMTAPAAYPTVPQSYTSAGAYAPALSTGASSPGSSVEPYEYPAAIDPALEAAGAAPLTAPLAAPPTSYGGTQGFQPNLKGELDDASPYGSTAAETHNQRGGATPTQATMTATDPFLYGDGMLRTSMAHLNVPAKRIKIADLFSVGGAAPPTSGQSNEPPPTLSPAFVDEIKGVYLSTYAPAIDQFLETTWYSLRGLTILLGNSSLCQMFATFLNRSRMPYSEEDVSSHNATQSFEMSLIWSLMGMCRSVAIGTVASDVPGANGSSRDVAQSPNQHEGLTEVVERMNIIEVLLSGTILDNNPISVTDPNQAQHDVVKVRESQFWQLVGDFVSMHDDEASATKQVDDTLKAIRNLLDNRENRDIIYSIAIVRHIGQRAAEFPNDLPEAVNNDEQVAGNQLLVAKAFIERETSFAANVVFQRLCTMAMKSWELMATVS